MSFTPYEMSLGVSIGIILGFACCGLCYKYLAPKRSR